jgi:hypothetical protein
MAQYNSWWLTLREVHDEQQEMVSLKSARPKLVEE